ncbi:hypothetical protein [Thalassotalea marina]|uniref:Uncharacterized protein n=1 Tax=Thalassotalea marina TaxID=1673741 RepID=A0A919EP99_9GAMM|nr:hypothetical protein [Thalassotalea marina]GHG07735.1 hypothetical protein GCM10017161_41780 [Thalassotalea marina]
MFSQLMSMITQAKLNGIHLMIRPTPFGGLTVTVAAESSGQPCDNAKLAAVMTQGLTLQGSVVELDEQFFTHVEAYAQTYTSALTANTERLIEPSPEVVDDQPSESVNDDVTDSVILTDNSDDAL